MKVHPLQALVDGMNAHAQTERTPDGMTLGSLIAWLESKPQDAVVRKLGPLDSYRGYYCDLAFAPYGERTVGMVLAECRQAMGQVFTGYKGGEYVMGATTPLWSAEYGSCGPRIVAMTENAPYEPCTREEKF